MNTSTLSSTNEQPLLAQWNKLKEENPQLRIRDAADLLQVGEAQLLATGIGPDCIRLEGDWKALLERLPSLGRVMSLTRNASCVLEHKGRFEEVKTFGQGNHSMGTVIGPIETRVFFKQWHVGFACRQQSKGRELTSIQIFDKAGDAITKIYLTDESDLEAYAQLVIDFTSPDQSPEQPVESIQQPEFASSIDENTFLQGWSELKDTHDFFPLLRKHKVSRHHAIRIAEGDFSQQISIEALEHLLDQAAMRKLPIMVFAGNHGNLQIHQGPVKNIKIIEGRGNSDAIWLNVLDPNFNMHLRQDHISEVWIVNKPSTDGLITSIEVFDKEKNMIVQFFGLRKPGQHQLTEWETVINELQLAEQ